MKFNSTVLPLLPTPQQERELENLLAGASELNHLYAALEQHPRVQGSEKSLDLFNNCRDQLQQDFEVIAGQLELIVAMASMAKRSKGKVGSGAASSACPLSGIFPDAQPMAPSPSVAAIMRRVFQAEELFGKQLQTCLVFAQNRKHLRMELQLKMMVLSATQRGRLLEDRYGFARSKTLLFQGLKRQTTRFLSALHGETRTDIDW